MPTRLRIDSSAVAFFILAGLNTTLLRGQQAQSGCPGTSSYALLRQDDDNGYRLNADSNCPADFWDSLKGIPLGSDDRRYVTIGGQLREWYEQFDNAKWGIGPQDENGYLLHRLTLFGDFQISDRVRFFVQLTNNMETGERGGPRPQLDEAKLFLEQAFVDIHIAKPHDSALTLRLGRQELEFGSGRLVDVRDGPNVHQTFDGADLVWKSRLWHLDGFVTKPVLNFSPVMDDPPDHGTTFWGMYAVRQSPFAWFPSANLDLFYLGIDRAKAAFDKGAGQEIRHTVGARFWGGRKAFDYDHEGVFQWGSFAGGDIRAWSIDTNEGYNLRALRFQPRFGLKFLAASGDSGPASSTLGTFNALFPTGYFFGQGFINLNGLANLTHVGPNLNLHATKAVTVQFADDLFWRTNLHDGIYDLGGQILISGQANGKRYVGSQPSVGIYWQADRHLLVSAAYNHFFAGPFLKDTKSPGKNVNYVAISASYTF